MGDNKEKPLYGPLGLTPSSLCMVRLKHDLGVLMKDPTPGIHVYPEPNDFLKISAMLQGPEGTPYEGGFFYFIMRCPADYPIESPFVTFQTTNRGSVRFNPNLYANGKVCLSILGTWEGPGWSAAQSLSSVLISIRSLMNENPYHNEPGFEVERKKGDAQAYNECIKHETIRVAVCGMLEGSACSGPVPEPLMEKVREAFLEQIDKYRSICNDNISKDGTMMIDPFGEKRGTFRYGEILKRIDDIYAKLHTQTPDQGDEAAAEESSEDEAEEEEEEDEEEAEEEEEELEKEGVVRDHADAAITTNDAEQPSAVGSRTSASIVTSTKDSKEGKVFVTTL